MSRLDDRLAERQKRATEAAQAVARPVDPPAGAPAITFQPAEQEAMTGQVVPADRIPDPQDPETDDDTLTEAEEKRLKAYESILEQQRDVWWKEGKCLAGVIKGKLHRRRYRSVEAYLDARWEGISRPKAYRRIELWLLGERLSPMGDNFNERQARALKSYWKQHGMEAVEALYRTFVEVAPALGKQVTATLIEDTLTALPAGEYDKDAHVGLVRAFLAGTVKPAAPALPPAPDPEEWLEQVRASLRRSINVKKLHDMKPEVKEKLAEELRALADELAAE